jgi:hypothetical protein
MPVSAAYLETKIITAAVARRHGVEAFGNMSQKVGLWIMSDSLSCSGLEAILSSAWLDLLRSLW